MKELQSLALDVKVLTENNDELIIREFDDEDDRDARRDDRHDVEQDFDFGLPDEDEEDESIGSIFDEAGEDEDFVSDDLFSADEDEDEDDLSDVDDDFSFGDLFGDEEKDDASDASDDTSASDLFGDEDDE